jgi:hypothetical protein
MAVPKLARKVSDASSSCSVMSVCGCLSCEKHDDEAELRMKRDLG